MNISRTDLMGKKVYNPDGSYVGEVHDVGLSVGETRSVLMVMISPQVVTEVPWEKVSTAKDILILKENFDLTQATQMKVDSTQTANAPSTQATQMKVDSTQTANAPSTQSGSSNAPSTQRGSSKGVKVLQAMGGKLGRKREKIVCNACGKNATWIEKYQAWYCYNCEKYVE